jgi:hypothetical protein
MFFILLFPELKSSELFSKIPIFAEICFFFKSSVIWQKLNLLIIFHRAA